MKYATLLIIAISLTHCSSPDTQENNTSNTSEQLVEPIPLDRRYLSGLDLSPVKSSWDPDRKLFQKRLYRGADLGVYVVSSETATATWDDYGIDEFIYVINGRARLRPSRQPDEFFTPGAFFVAPYGYQGEWETQGGTEYYHELSVVAVQPDTSRKSPQHTPYRLDIDKIAGIGLSESEDPDLAYTDLLYDGAQLSIKLHAHLTTDSLQAVEVTKDELIYVIAGSIEYITDDVSTTYYAGDFFILPEGYKGDWLCRGHHLYRYLSVTKAG